MYPNNRRAGVPLWLSRLRIWHCHYFGSDYHCGVASVPGLGTSASHRCGPKKFKKKKKKNTHAPPGFPSLATVNKAPKYTIAWRRPGKVDRKHVNISKFSLFLLLLSKAENRGLRLKWCHSHCHARSQLRLWPILQLKVTPDPLTHWVRPGIEAASSWMLVRV